MLLYIAGNANDIYNWFTKKLNLKREKSDEAIRPETDRRSNEYQHV